MVKRLILASVLLIFVSLANYAQNIGGKSNLLYWATTTPNLGVETACKRLRVYTLHNSKKSSNS